MTQATDPAPAARPSLSILGLMTAALAGVIVLGALRPEPGAHFANEPERTALVSAAGLLPRSMPPTMEGLPTAGPLAYVAESGDTTRSIAARFFGDPSLSTLIEEANRRALQDRPPQAGDTLIIPSL
ncbi:LysM peptidoglycan-binding domain-containing protein [Histidinibacterium aquaticum]|uniref:LysM peptidoglycan-binding domain-containing protein n=1 Tax=Histidinibacterium aquaticum TaxID=2613962 RepID=A0A5J5GD78_9RHOB|nr:LysM peptidoglycan-binding domain-containing protein [Histidinibacterium aquaticum]KAA9006146.1 LysM peptidoglycan-binding domain-containing protein [Histidinibacterium aquaticum]